MILSRLTRLRSVVAVRPKQQLPFLMSRGYTTSMTLGDAATQDDTTSTAATAADNNNKDEDEESTGTGNILKKQDVVKIIAEKHDLSYVKTKSVVETFIHTITEALKEDKSVSFAKFGSFSTFVSKSKMGRNPNTGESMEIKPKRRIKFTSYKNLKRTISGDTD